MRLELVLLPLACFGMADAADDPATFAQTHFLVVRVESAPPDEWVNIHHVLVWLPPLAGSEADTVSFLWLSETTGYAHVQLCRSTHRKSAKEPIHSALVDYSPDLKAHVN